MDFFVKRMKLCVPRTLFAGAPEAIGECLAGWGQGWSTGIGVIPYQFTEVSQVTLSEMDETWWVGSPSELR